MVQSNPKQHVSLLKADLFKIMALVCAMCCVTINPPIISKYAFTLKLVYSDFMENPTPPDDEEIRNLAYSEIRGKAHSSIRTYLREKVPEKWHQSLLTLRQNIEADEDDAKEKAEIEKRPVDLQMFEMKFGWMKREIDAKIKESKAILEERRQLSLNENFSLLVKEFKEIRVLLEQLIHGRKR